MKQVKNRSSTFKTLGYDQAGASTSRRALKSFIPASGSPVDDIDVNNKTLRQRSRMLYMASPIAASAINTNRTKIVGTGLTFKSNADSNILGMSYESIADWQSKVEAEFKLWTSKRQNCDALAINNFAGLQQLAVKSWLMSGDVFVLVKREHPTAFNPYSLRLHIIEADRISTPTAFKAMNSYRITEGIVPEGQVGAGHKIHDGVEVNESGKVVAYYISNRHPNAEFVAGLEEWTRVEAFGKETGLPNILHIMDSERPDQYRGVPYIAPVIETLLQVRRYTESELMAALVQSFFTAWIETDTDQSEIPINEVGGAEIAGYPTDNPYETEQEETTENEYELGPGTVTHLAPGEKIVFGNPNIPTAGFETFLKAICRIAGSALEIPYEVLLKEFNSSYSASRGALLEAWEAFKMRREWFVEDFCQPIYELWLSEAVARGRIIAPGFFDDPLIRSAWCKAQWIGPIQGQLDPKKEAEAAIRLVEVGVKSHEQITRELGGGDWAKNVERLTIENELLAEANKPIAGLENYVKTDNEEMEGEELE